MPYCTQCGDALGETARFCPSCGVSRHSDAPVSFESNQGSSETSQESSETSQESSETSQESSGTNQGSSESSQGRSETSQGSAGTDQGNAGTSQESAEISQESAGTIQTPLPGVEKTDKFRFLKLLGIGIGVVFGAGLLFAIFLLIGASFPVVLAIGFALLVATKIIGKSIKDRRKKNDGGAD